MLDGTGSGSGNASGTPAGNGTGARTAYWAEGWFVDEVGAAGAVGMSEADCDAAGRMHRLLRLQSTSRGGDA